MQFRIAGIRISPSSCDDEEVTVWFGLHLALSGAVEGLFAWKFGHGPRPVAAHLLLIAEWDLALAGVLHLALSVAPSGSRAPWRLARALLALTGTLQI